MEVAILVYGGFDELDAIGPYEVFENAADAGADCSVSLRTIEATDPVTASHDLTIQPDGPLDAVEPDLLVVPGGGWNDRSTAGAWSAAEEGTIPQRIRALHDEGVSVAGVCTGGMLLARAGVLDGRPAVTHAGALADLRATDAEVVDARVVDDGDVLTAGGVTSGLDLAVHLVDREFGSEVAETVRTEMEYEPRGRVHR
ncbi:DJ-1/PfpI family protein [Halovenus sp. WSH3]|uniref:DJ-1/PfpI family protein n=1 Tax=Halovenus carboxidivorans TaxID=2692199 RepID=A0A6B0SXH2_9EURY|nr:DJ-1/PfpI family protein [Halovenus carboxidivorans]MXR50035.1 DJ-1/PfpI family protein [Halovenus carboxidivorans]